MSRGFCVSGRKEIPGRRERGEKRTGERMNGKELLKGGGGGGGNDARTREEGKKLMDGKWEKGE